MRSVGLLRLFAVASLGALFCAPAFGYALDNLRTTDDIGLNKVPHQGTSRVLVIAMRVGGPFEEGVWNTLVNEYNPEGGPGSFRDFWRTESNGAYDPIPYLAPPLIYPECPIPELGDSCRINVEDFNALISGDIQALLVELFERVRDENQINLSEFDVNSADCPQGQACSDGYFDGVVLHTSMFQGIAFPLAALGNEVVVHATPQPLPVPSDGGITDGGADGGAAPVVDAGPAGPLLTCGIIALSPPRNHEYGHTLGLIDQYAGPTMTGLMSQSTSGMAAYNRLALGWGEDEEVTGPGTYTLAPVLEGGRVLRFGQPPRMVLLENRGGPQHSAWENDHPGLYMYAIDETQLPTTALGFFQVLQGRLYYPNEDPPYLNVNVPLDCNAGSPANVFDPCVASAVGNVRDVEHTLDGHLGYHVAITDIDEVGNITIEVREGTRDNPVEPDPDPDDAGMEPDPEPTPEPDSSDAGPEPDMTGDDCGCTGTYGASWPAALLGVVLFLVRGRRRRSGRRS